MQHSKFLTAGLGLALVNGMDTLVVNPSWLQSHTCMQVHLCMAQGTPAHEWLSAGKEQCHPLQGTLGNVITGGEAASGIQWSEAIDTAKKPYYAQEASSTAPSCLTLQEIPAPKWQSLLNEPSWCTWFFVQRCVRINVPCERWCLTENDLFTQAAPAVSLTSAFPAPLSEMFAHGVSDWWVERLALPGFPMGVWRVLPLTDSFFSSGVKISLIIRT